MGILQKLLGKGKAPPTDVRPDENLQQLYREFWESFYIAPGVRLADRLKELGETRLIEWLRPETECALPNSIIRLLVGGIRKGYKFWELEGISSFYEGNWTANGGLPPDESLEALTALARITGKPVTLYYKEVENGPIMVVTFPAERCEG